jgi:hypothetical protein
MLGDCMRIRSPFLCTELVRTDENLKDGVPKEGIRVKDSSVHVSDSAKSAAIRRRVVVKALSSSYQVSDIDIVN